MKASEAALDNADLDPVVIDVEIVSRPLGLEAVAGDRVPVKRFSFEIGRFGISYSPPACRTSDGS